MATVWKLIGAAFIAASLLSGSASLTEAAPLGKKVIATCQNGAPRAAILACSAILQHKELSPIDRARAYVQRGNAYARLGNRREALADYRSALKLDPANQLAAAGRERLSPDDGLEEDASTSSPDTVEAPTVPAPALESGEPAAAASEPAKTETEIVAKSPEPGSQDSATPQAAVAETRIALVVGNATYAAVGKLPNPFNDSEAVATALRDSGFSEVTVIHDAARAELVAALNEFADKAASADWAVVYFAGHGIELDGINYLIPVDAHLMADRDIQDEAVALDRVLTAVERARKLKLVILDACRNNPFVPDMRLTVASRSVSRGLARIEPSGGTLVAYAAKGGQEALDGEGTANSPFAAALVTRLKTPGLEIGKLFRLVRDDVLAATDARQEPFIYGSLPGEDFFFRPN